MDTNLKAVMRVTRDVMPHLTRPGCCHQHLLHLRAGRLSGHHGLRWPRPVWRNSRDSWRVRSAPLGIRVNAIAPGVIETSAMTEGHRKNPDYQRAMITPTPLRRAGQPEEIASVAAFLASADASFVTGK